MIYYRLKNVYFLSVFFFYLIIIQSFFHSVPIIQRVNHKKSMYNIFSALIIYNI